MKAQIQAKTRNRGRGWAEYRRPDVKNGIRGPSRGTTGDALITDDEVRNKWICVYKVWLSAYRVKSQKSTKSLSRQSHRPANHVPRLLPRRTPPAHAAAPPATRARCRAARHPCTPPRRPPPAPAAAPPATCVRRRANNHARSCANHRAELDARYHTDLIWATPHCRPSHHPRGTTPAIPPVRRGLGCLDAFAPHADANAQLSSLYTQLDHILLLQRT
jgi:hypothetical protein